MTVTKEEHQKLVSKYNELHKRYRHLEERHAKCDDYMGRAYEKYKSCKAIVNEWKAWYDRHQLLAGSASRNTPCDSEPAERSSPQRVTSSQTTEGEEASSEALIYRPESDDEPQVVSVRSVKRRRGDSTRDMPPPVYIKQEPTSPDNPIDLASQDYSSPQFKRERPVRTETSDLDALVEHIDTPRKRKQRRAISEEAAKARPLLPATSSLSEGNSPENDELLMRVKTESGAQVPHFDPAVTARDFAIKPAIKSDRGSALQSISVNIPSMPRTGNAQTARKRKRRYKDANGKVAILSEDGDYQTSQMTALHREDVSKDHVSRRLNTLLEEKSPDRPPLPKRHTPETSSKRKRERQSPPSTQQAGITKRSPKLAHSAFKLPRGLEKQPPSVLAEDEPLRCRPLRSLRLDDFKINPKYMGADFAFADTFRGRDQRRCLQGCTKPECCGDAFRKAVEVGAVQSNKTDAEVLEQYLGQQWDKIIGSYGPEKRRDLLIQARAHALANQHGKHRQAFERRSTPPGFWRTDMPTTQEEEEDRARGQEMERQKVEERWREAMRDGGRWMFRDE